MKRSSAVVGASAVGVAATVAARKRFQAHLQEGTLPGRAGSWVNSYLGRPGYRLVAQVLDVGPEDDVLDVACGWGEFLVAHAAQAHSVAGIDWSAEKVALARERLADRIRAGTAELAHGDAANLPWPDATFSAVSCIDAFPFFTDPSRVLAEMLRVLRPAGRMVMQVGMRWPDGSPKHVPHPRSHAIDPGDEAAVLRLVEQAGFTAVSAHYGPSSGGPVGHWLDVTLMKSDELRVVRGVKPG
jgi:SAM-dependent methyltransferase